MKAIIAAIVLILISIQPAITDTNNKVWLDWFRQINPHLRTAVAYLRTENLDFAALSLEELIAIEPASNIPASLALAATSVISEAETALAEIDDGKVSPARNRLLGLREALFIINRENNIEVFDDCIWAVRKAGPSLWHYHRNKPDFTDIKQRQQVVTATSNYLTQIEKCETIAPDEIKADVEWNRVALGAITSLRRINSESIPNNDVGQFIRFIRELRSLNNLLYFRYG